MNVVMLADGGPGHRRAQLLYQLGPMRDYADNGIHKLLTARRSILDNSV